jgi:hypothetical protein
MSHVWFRREITVENMVYVFALRAATTPWWHMDSSGSEVVRGRVIPFTFATHSAFYTRSVFIFRQTRTVVRPVTQGCGKTSGPVIADKMHFVLYL